MGGKRQLEVRQIRVLRGGKRQGSKVEEGADQNQKEEEDFERDGDADGCSDFWLVLLSSTVVILHRKILRTYSWGSWRDWLFV